MRRPARTLLHDAVAGCTVWRQGLPARQIPSANPTVAAANCCDLIWPRGHTHTTWDTPCFRAAIRWTLRPPQPFPYQKWRQAHPPSRAVLQCAGCKSHIRIPLPEGVSSPCEHPVHDAASLRTPKTKTPSSCAAPVPQTRTQSRPTGCETTLHPSTQDAHRTTTDATFMASPWLEDATCATRPRPPCPPEGHKQQTGRHDARSQMAGERRAPNGPAWLSAQGFSGPPCMACALPWWYAMECCACEWCAGCAAGCVASTG